MMRGKEAGKQFALLNSETVVLEPLRKEARIGTDVYGKKGVKALRLARATVKFLFQKSVKQSLHYFFLGLSVLIYRTVCEDACINVSVCRFSRQFPHWLSACLIAQWLLKACSNIPSFTRRHRMPRYITRRWGACYPTYRAKILERNNFLWP